MSSLFFYIIFFLNIIFVLVLIFLERKEPIYIFAWTLLLLFLPVVGFFLYLIFGNGPRIRKRNKFKEKKKWDELYEETALHQESKINLHEDLENAAYSSIMKFNLKSSGSLFTEKNQVSIFTNGQEKFDALLNDVRNAEKTIHILYYIFRIDDIGKELLEILEQKAKDGVEVRVIYDDVGSSGTSLKQFQTLIENGGEVYRFFPTLFKFISFNINYRNHRKIVVVDGKIGYTGGMNVGDEYLSRDKKLTPWRDTHLRIEGEAAAFLQMRFLKDYFYAVDEDHSKPEATEEKLRDFFPERDQDLPNKIVQIISSGPDTEGEEIKDSLVKMIYGARSTIDIQTPYFVPDKIFLQALRTASLSGVRVRLMVPKINDNHFVDRIISSHLPELLEMGVEVYYYAGFLHAKTLTIDSKITTVGTANLDVRSFQLNFEVNAYVYDDEVGRQMTDIFETDLESSVQVTDEDLKKKNWFVKLEENIYRLFSLVM